MLPCKHHSSQSCLCSSGGTGCFHSQVCHRYGKQAAHASQLKSCRLKRARPAAAATVKMLFGNHLLRELYKESKIPGRDAGLVLLHFLAVTNTKKLLSQNKAFLPLQRHISRQGRMALYSWPSNVLLTIVSEDLFAVDSQKKKNNTQPVWMKSYAKAQNAEFVFCLFLNCFSHTHFISRFCNRLVCTCCGVAKFQVIPLT